MVDGTAHFVCLSHTQSAANDWYLIVLSRVYFSGPTFLVLADISLDRGYPHPLKIYPVQEIATCRIGDHGGGITEVFGHRCHSPGQNAPLGGRHPMGPNHQDDCWCHCTHEGTDGPCTCEHVEPAPADGVGVNQNAIPFVPVCLRCICVVFHHLRGVGTPRHCVGLTGIKKMSWHSICSDKEAMLIHIVVQYLRHPSVNPYQGLLEIAMEDRILSSCP